MNTEHTPRAGRPAHRPTLGLLVAGLALALAACSGATASGVPAVPTEMPSVDIPTFPPDDLATSTASCIEPETMAVLDQLRAPGADVPTILQSNKDVLIDGLAGLESADPKTEQWRDALLTALDSGDLAGAADQVAVLVAGDLTITPC